MDGRLVTVHLADYAPGSPRHLPPGEGALDWPVILRALQERLPDSEALRRYDEVARILTGSRSATSVGQVNASLNFLAFVLILPFPSFSVSDFSIAYAQKNLQSAHFYS